MANEETKKNVPKNKYRSGTISVTQWDKEVTKGNDTFTVSNYQVTRGYKDDNDEWKDSNSFPKQDLPKLIVLLQKAYEEATVTEKTE